MGAARRWAVVAAGTLVLALLPVLIGRLPAGHSAVSARTLLHRVQSSAGVPYSGYAEADGGLALPVSDSNFSELADLLGGTTDLRVWWRATTDWRVDAVALTGEQDVAQDDGGIWTWDYEANRARRTPYDAPPTVRAPRADDLLPGTLARRLLSGATAAEISRIADVRVAGEDAAGLRLRPSAPASTIDHVDVWALPDTGLPVRVEVHGRSGPAVMTTAMLDLDTGRPGVGTTSFAPPSGADIEYDSIPDIASAIDQLAPVRPPAQLAGLTRAPSYAGTVGAVGVYGRGVTILIAVPLSPRLSDFIGEQVGARAVASGTDGALVLGIGPINLRLTAPAVSGARWLLVGTVTAATLKSAEPHLPVPGDFFR